MSIAQFLKYTPNLSKKQIGIFISKPQNHLVLEKFVKLSSMEGKFLGICFRNFFSSFVLSSGTNNILETFSNSYLDCNKKSNQDRGNKK